MSDYPVLTRMGVKSLESVVRYSVRHEGEADVLKIYYNRPVGSFLSRSKKFTFTRGCASIPRQIRTGSGFEELNKISPMLLEAISELKKLEARHHSAEAADPKERLINSLDHLEKVLESKLSEIRREIEALK